VESGVLALLGAGKQARLHLSAMIAVRDLTTVKVFSPTPERRKQFAEDMAAALAIDVIAVTTTDEALEGADIIVAATNSNVSVVPGALLREGVHVTSTSGWLPRA
jgi:alanine dehydrogenase